MPRGQTHSVECRLYRKLDDNFVQCQTCRHACKIRDGSVGVCGVRQNIGGRLQLLVYGKVAAMHVDPIEKKPLFHFLPGSSTFSFGTLGCNFRCDNCHNAELSQMSNAKGRVKDYAKLSWGESVSPAEIVASAQATQCQSIAYTYNEPTVFFEYALDTMQLARKAGLKNVWVSNGYMSSQTLDAIIPYLDAVNVDIKSGDESFYQKSCGGKLQAILENCQHLVREKIWLEITTLVIPTLSDGAETLAKVAAFIAKELGDFVPWHVSAFSGAISWKLQDLPDTPVKTIQRAYRIGQDAGLEYVYAGNVWDRDTESTRCPQCGKMVIERSGYQVTRHDRDGACPGCKTVLAGVYH
ncbi:MAG: AmmeMemoRadiSam system radical SAM enzyme [Patescibacteria group bacterium]|nr:AmmeMemoRadiSam system radical SAM enzyme [Patescibacteria group bacterium]